MKKKTVFIKIDNCCECPHVTSQRHYTADSFETEFDYFCKLEKGKYLANLDWHEKQINVPAWCPLTGKKK